MKLEAKGLIIAPPVLTKYPQAVSADIQQWPGIISATHWYLYDTSQVDGADFYVGEQELGHIHLDGEIHLSTGRALQALLLKNNLAEKFPYGEGWVQYTVTSRKSAAHALWLFKLNYDRLNGMDSKRIAEVVNAHIDSTSKRS